MSNGFTLVELAVTILLGSMVMGLALKVVVDQRRLFLEDQTRIQADQNLRTATDLIGTDIKQTGERLESDLELSGISVIDGGTVSGVPQPDQLVLQRKLIPDVLLVCERIGGGGTDYVVDVAVNGNPQITNCPSSDADSNGVPDTVEQFRNYRWSPNDPPGTNPPVRNRNLPSADSSLSSPQTNCRLVNQASGTDGECAWAYIHNPGSNRGEFFLYSYEDSGNCSDISSRTCYRIRAYPRPNDPVPANRGTWQYTYNDGYSSASPPADPARIYILEERRYSLVTNTNTTPCTNNCILSLIVNRQTANPLRLVNQLRDFQIQAQTSAGWVNSFNDTLIDSNPTCLEPTSPNPCVDWQQVQAVGVTLTAMNPDPSVNVRAANLRLESQFLPRNALSR